jgi:hypothetical protein
VLLWIVTSATGGDWWWWWRWWWWRWRWRRRYGAAESVALALGIWVMVVARTAEVHWSWAKLIGLLEMLDMRMGVILRMMRMLALEISFRRIQATTAHFSLYLYTIFFFATPLVPFIIQSTWKSPSTKG